MTQSGIGRRGARWVALLVLLLAAASGCDSTTRPSLGEIASTSPPLPRAADASTPPSAPLTRPAPTALNAPVAGSDTRPWQTDAPSIVSPSPPILFEDLATGARGFYTMNGTTLGAWNPIITAPAELRMVGYADFTGENQPDLLFENSRDGSRWVLKLSGADVPIAWLPINTVPTEWHIAGTAPLTGSTTADILWQNTLTGEIGLYRMSGTTVLGWTPIGRVAPDLRMVAVGDFTGDGKLDLVFENLRDGGRWVMQMNGAAAIAWWAIGTVPTQLRIRGAGDFTDDGKLDLLFENIDDGSRWILRMVGTSAQAWISFGTLPTSWHITGAKMATTPGVGVGALAVTITGLPGGVAGNVSVTGPNAYAATVSVSGTLSNLTPGTYTIAAQSVISGGITYTPGSSQIVTVSANSTANATVAYVPVTVTYGSAAERVRVLDVGQSYSPAVTILVGTQPQPVTSATFRSRATSVVTVDALGRITAVGPGQSWVAASFPGASDSVFVQVTRTATGPVMRANLTNYDVRVGDELLVTFTLDPRGVPVGAASVAIGYEYQNAMFSVLSAIVPTQTPLPAAYQSSEGLFRVTVASATGLTTPVAMLQLRLLARLSGRAGFLTFTSLDVVGIDGVGIDAQVTSTRYPVIIK